MIVKYVTTTDFYTKHHESLPFHKVISKEKVFSKDTMNNRISVVFSLNRDEKMHCDRIFGQIGEE